MGAVMLASVAVWVVFLNGDASCLKRTFVPEQVLDDGMRMSVSKATDRTSFSAQDL